MDRREFIKTSCGLCVAVAAGLSISTFSSCSSLPLYKTVIHENKISVPISFFGAGNFILVRPQDYEYDIAVRKEEDGKYEALLMRCTHADNQLISTGNGFICNLHGSRFDKDGAVTQGPAEHSLRKFSTEITSDNILIYLT